MTQKLFKQITNWQSKTFPKSTPSSYLTHLKEEIKELQSDIISNNPNKNLEYADCLILLIGAAAKDNLSYNDIINSINTKMSINIKRKWNKPSKTGVYKHIK